jgi:hypothetical protein
MKTAQMDVSATTAVFTAPTAAVPAAPTTAVLTAPTRASLSVEMVTQGSPDVLKTAEVVGLETAGSGKARPQVTVPVSPSPMVVDTVYFEDPRQPATLFYLPRYRIAVQRVSGAPHYRVRLAEVNGQWRLDITLESFAAPELGTAPAQVSILPHQLTARLRWEIANTGGATRELAFTERLDNADGTRTIALTLATLQERDELYTALTNQAAHAVLLIQRVVSVAIPTTVDQVKAPKQAVTMRASDLVAAEPTDAVFRIAVPGGMLPESVQPVLPIPELEATGAETYEANGETWVRYRLRVKNWQAYGDELFAPSPDLPPCGNNSNASRTWVDIYDGSNHRLYGFCALGQATNLQQLWFALRPTASVVSVYIELVDRRANLSARSNLVTPPSVVLYNEVTRGMEMAEALFFNADLHSYIFQGFSGGPARPLGLAVHQVNYKGQWHVYYQDEVQPHRCYYLPDAFKLMRQLDARRAPVLKLELLGTDAEQYRLTYVAMPYFDWDRLEAAEVELQRHIPANHPIPIAMEPFQTNAVTFVPFNPLLYQAGTTASLNLNMVQSTVTLSRDDFATVWDELSGAAALSLGGKIQVAVEGLPTQELPLILRLDDTVGELLAVTTTTDEINGGYQLTLRNAVESPLRVTILGSFVQSTQQGLADVRPATWRGLTLPAEPLPPGGQFQAFLVPPMGVSLQAYVPLVDTDQVQVIPATEQLFNAMLAGSVREYQRAVTVQVPSALFNHASGKIAAIQVTFIGGQTIVLSPPSDPNTPIVSATAKVLYPLKDVLLGNPITNWYKYNVVVAWVDGRVSPPSEPEAGEAESFFLRVPQLN